MKPTDDMLKLAKAVVETGFIENLADDEVDCAHCNVTADHYKKLAHAADCPMILASDVLLLRGNYSANKTFQYRPHQGGLAESMDEVKTFSSKAELVKEARKFYGHLVPKNQVTSDTVHAVPYGGYAPRIGWETHLVVVDGVGPIGFTDGPVE